MGRRLRWTKYHEKEDLRWGVVSIDQVLESEGRHRSLLTHPNSSVSPRLDGCDTMGCGEHSHGLLLRRQRRPGRWRLRCLREAADLAPEEICPEHSCALTRYAFDVYAEYNRQRSLWQRSARRAAGQRIVCGCCDSIRTTAIFGEFAIHYE